MAENNKLVLLLGCNLGDKKHQLQSAIMLIEKQIGKLNQQSSIFESRAWGFESKDIFYNQVLCVDSNLTPQLILQHIFEIENSLGRKAKTKDIYESRTIDIDILFYNDLIIEEPNLIIPHPRLHLRRFTLAPLAEIIPDFIHPIFKKKLRTLLTDCEDNSSVNIVENEKGF